MCSMSAGLRSTPARRTQQMIVIQDKVHIEAPYTTDFLSRRTLFPSLLPVLSNTSTPSTVYLEREKDHRLTAVKKRSVSSDFSELSGGQQGSLGQSTMVWTAKLLLCSGAGGLAVQPYMATK